MRQKYERKRPTEKTKKKNKEKVKEKIFMKLTYYGTAAAEGMPAFFCNCDNCERARKAGGKNIRSRSQALVNNDLLIDFPADTYMHVAWYGLDLRKVENILITHSHMDHLCPADLANTRPPYALRDDDAGKFKVYMSQASSAAALPTLIKEGVLDSFVDVVTVKPFEPFKVLSYEITPLKASHDLKTAPLIYIISDGKKTMLYGHDSGWFPKETWAWLEENKPKFDYVSLDCTCTCDKGNPYPDHHMNLEACSNVKSKMLEIGCADEKTIFCLHHFSHNGGYTYDELVPVAKELGFLVSYDTMSVEF